MKVYTLSHTADMVSISSIVFSFASDSGGVEEKVSFLLGLVIVEDDVNL